VKRTSPWSVLSEEEAVLLDQVDHPTWLDPMLATLTDAPFSDAGWIFERKLDGIRCLSFRKGNEIKLYSRKRQPLERTYPEVAEQLLHQRSTDFVMDGEVVAFAGSRTSFALLQQRSGITDPLRARRSGVTVSYYVFDLLHLEERDTRALPLLARKRLLEAAIDFSGPLRFTEHRSAEGRALLEEACANGWEGLIAKRANSKYTSRRSTNWLKLKCSQGQEFVIGGFTEPSGTRTGFGALLVGYYDHGSLVYAGKVGTGFDEKTLRDLKRRMVEIESAVSPFAPGPRRFDKGSHFLEPTLVAQVEFTEWTRDGMLRHPRFVGLRQDKKAQEVTREDLRRT
jgi:bifunctional non-homologous end joining protein LigD